MSNIAPESQGKAPKLVEMIRIDYQKGVVRKLSLELERELTAMAEALALDTLALETWLSTTSTTDEITELRTHLNRLILITHAFLQANKEEATRSGDILDLYDSLADAQHHVHQLLNPSQM